MNWTVWIGIGSIFGALGVGLGAFGAHALKGRLSDHYLNVFEHTTPLVGNLSKPSEVQEVADNM